jgi:predicted  nucleic acid-binding Zn-ribbon protein
MQCKECGYVVPQNLKFAIMKNFCPQCGQKLFTEKEMNHISMIQSRVVKQDFSRDMDDEIVYDVALFIYNEVTSGYGRVLLDEEIKRLLSAKKESDSDVEVDVEDIPVAKDLEKVKAQIREEEAARVALESRAASADEDVDDRVQRLKRLHKNNPIKSKNPVVRRIEP